MPLQPGTTLGPSETLSPIGAGGMGEVYRARDTRLHRTVSIKGLPEHVAADPDLKQRFEREAKTISSLNHPHICTLHDIGSQITAVSLLVCLASAALTLPGCGRPEQRLPDRTPGNIKAAEVKKTDDASYHVRWTVEPPGSTVAVFASTDPANIPHTEPLAESTEAEAIVSGLDPRQRYYFELVPAGGRGFVSATRFVTLQGARNVRDLGGYETRDGRRVRWGNVFRSDELTNLTDADVALRSGPRNLDSGLSEISIVFQAAVPKPVAPKYTTSGVRRPSEL